VADGGVRTRIHLWISGRVQGVGFRFAACQQAGRLGLGGWVRNLGDGSVEAVFEGPAADVAQAVAWCRYGPPGARVSDVRRESETPVGEDAFRERPTKYGTSSG
jgi:acylphosphatase